MTEEAGNPMEAAKREILVRAADLYLKDMHSTLWGRSFEVIAEKGRAEAANWIVDIIEGVAKRVPDVVQVTETTT